MAKVKVKALDTFTHGRVNATRGATYTMNSGEAESLEKAGLVEIAGKADDNEIDDLVGGDKKMAPMTSNKMMPKAENKGKK